MYGKIENNVCVKWPYTIDDLRRDNSQVSFPLSLDATTLETHGVFLITITEAPPHDPATKTATRSGCVLNADKGRWETSWTIRDKTADELQAEADARAAKVEAQRAEAYRTESDPLFFKSQRGEATRQEWLDKVAEIKARFPA